MLSLGQEMNINIKNLVGHYFETEKTSKVKQLNFGQVSQLPIQKYLDVHVVRENMCIGHMLCNTEDHLPELVGITYGSIGSTVIHFCSLILDIMRTCLCISYAPFLPLPQTSKLQHSSLLYLHSDRSSTRAHLPHFESRGEETGNSSISRLCRGPLLQP